LESLGGDSLRYIQFSMQFEKRFGILPDKWESLSVSQLQGRAKRLRRSGWCSLEASTLMRAIAITFIVARHTAAFIYSRNYAAGVLLFALGGYSLARFQLPEIIRKGSVRSAVATALLIAIPTILVTIQGQLATHTFEPLQYLLISNFLDPSDPYRARGVTFYFSEIYFQLLLLAAVFFSFAKVRQLFRDHPIASALCLFAAAVAAKFLFARFWNTDYLFNRVPQTYAWSFCLGLLVGLARTPQHRLLAMLLVAISCDISWGLASSSTYLMAGGIALVLFIPAVRVPELVKSVVGGIAAASMFIYLSHWEVITLVNKVFGEREPWLALVAALVTGVAFAYVYGHAQRLLGQTRIGRRFFESLSG
jgi:hypothetical protein